MKPLRLIGPPLVLALALLAAFDSTYVVGQGQQAVLLRLGQPVAAINAAPAAEAGLHVKWPFEDRAVLLDRRTLALLSPPVEAAAGSPGALQADMRYRIRDPLRFYRNLGDQRLGQQRLAEILQDSLERVLAGGAAAPNDRPAQGRTLLADLRNRAAKARLGIDILDARLDDAPPSAAGIDSLSQRMQETEARQVEQIRTQGEAHKRELTAQADRDAAGVRGEGERQALVIRGDGDAQRAAILGDAYGKDPAFAAFFRRLEAYDQALNPDNTAIVLSPDSGFLGLFGRGPEGAEAKAPR